VCVANKLSLSTSLLSRSAVVVAIGFCCYRAYLDRSITPPTPLPPSLPAAAAAALPPAAWCCKHEKNKEAEKN